MSARAISPSSGSEESASASARFCFVWSIVVARSTISRRTEARLAFVAKSGSLKASGLARKASICDNSSFNFCKSMI